MEIVKFCKSFIIILIAFCMFLGVEYLLLYKENESLKASVLSQQVNTKVLNFNKMFVEKVLKSDSEVSFEDRLKLENAVRGLNDPQILLQWQKFSGSATEADAQVEVKNLLDLLATKIAY